MSDEVNELGAALNSMMQELDSSNDAAVWRNAPACAGFQWVLHLATDRDAQQLKQLSESPEFNTLFNDGQTDIEQLTNRIPTVFLKSWITIDPSWGHECFVRRFFDSAIEAIQEKRKSQKRVAATHAVATPPRED